MRTITKEEMDAIGVRHGIHPRYRLEFLKLANQSLIDNKQFSTRLHSCLNYHEAYRDLLHLLSQPIHQALERRRKQFIETP